MKAKKSEDSGWLGWLGRPTLSRSPARTADHSSLAAAQHLQMAKKEIKWAELAEHDKSESAWLCIEHKDINGGKRMVYDVTEFLDEHPGGGGDAGDGWCVLLP